MCFTLEMQKYCGKIATIIGKDTHYSGEIYIISILICWIEMEVVWSWMAWMLLPVHHRKVKKALKAKVRL